MKLILAAHPDDETIACASLMLSDPEGCLVVHATDGAPAARHYWERNGFPSREAYRDARAAELAAALDLAGVPESNRVRLGLADLEACFDLPALEQALRDLAVRHGVSEIYAHAYEGGHPDHDACAVASARLGGMLERLEFPLYHQADGERTEGRFIGGGGIEVRLSEEHRQRKRAMLACFGSQRVVVDRFDGLVERFRPAPVYDFTRPPHQGQLYYETRPMGMTFARFQEAIFKNREAAR